MSFHLFRRPGSAFVLDDDEAYLRSLALVLPARWPIQLFSHPHHCLAALRADQEAWEQDCAAQEALVELWHQGRPIIPRLLSYWARHPARYGLIHVGVMDHSMPGLSGLQLFAQLSPWHASRVLLTGQVDMALTIDAFNRGLIDQYIPKQASDATQRLVHALDLLTDRCHDRHDMIWRVTVRPPQMALLRLGGAGRAMRQYMDRQWVEYVMLGDPFGVLGLDAEGQASWLQLRVRAELPAWVEQARREGMSDDLVRALREGRQMICPELQSALGHLGPGAAQSTFPLDETGQLLAALFPIPSPLLPEPIEGHRRWLARQPARRIERSTSGPACPR
jgi:CheY-like chemotaxis protein